MIMTQDQAARAGGTGESAATDRPADASAPDAARDEKPVNVGSSERWVSAVGGGALALYGLKRGGLGGTALFLLGGAMVYRGATGHCHGYAALGMDTSGGPAEPEQYFERGIHVEQSVSIQKSPWELYAFWKDFENLPTFMAHLKSVKKLDDKRSHWEAKAPAGMTVKWDAEIINDEPNALIAWRSLGGATVDNAGSVRFVPGPEGRGTEVKVVLDYIPPAGRFGAMVAKLFGEHPAAQVREDLRRFKRLMETGEIATVEGQPRGDCKGGGMAHKAWGDEV